MPFICLAQEIADGTVNILDLLPNSSLRNLILDPEGQTKYVNRTENEPVATNEAGLVLQDARGLSAYLVDHTEPGGSLTATGTVQVQTSVATNNVIIGGITFVAVNGGAVAASQQFNDTASATSDILSAASLVTAINDGASQTLISGANGGVVVAAANGGTDTVTLTASVAGPTGDLTLSTNSAPTMVLSGAAMARTASVWDPTSLGVATAALIARVDAGLPLTLADIDTILSAAGAELTDAGGSNSTGTVAELLSVLSGRGYSISANAVAYTAPGVWNPAEVGGFTEGLLTFDTEFNDDPNGTIVQHEVKPIKDTFDGGSLQESVLSGVLARMTQGVTLFTDNDLLPPIAGQQAQIDNARLVTVYNDDGSLLA
jgi:hypothetical protein